MKKLNFTSMALAGLLLAVAGLEFSGCKKGEEDPLISLRSRKARMTGEWTVASFSDNSTFVGESSDSDGDRYETEETTTSSWDGMSYEMVTVGSSSQSWDGGNSNSDYEEVAEDGDYSYSSSYSEGGSTSTYELDGDYTMEFSGTYTFNGDGTFSANVDMEYETDADGNFGGTTFNEQVTEVTSQTITGTWSFIDGNKADEFGNGERVALWYSTMDMTLEEEYVDTYGTSTTTDKTTQTTTFTSSDTDPDEVWELVMLKNKEIQVSRSYSYEVERSYDNTYTASWGSDSYSDDYSGTQSGSSSMTLTR